MTIVDLERFCRDMIKGHPDFRSRIIETYSLAHSEIDEGGSESHECELAEESIRQMIEGVGA